jgi:PAS domain S-box-containing protein
MQRSRNLVGVTLATSVAVLGIAGYFTYRSVDSLTEATDALVHTKDVTLALEGTLSMLRDAETGQRGYLLTGQAEYLEPYTSGLTQIQGHLSYLVSLMTTEPGAARSLERLSELVKLRIETLEQGVALQRAGDYEAARSLILSGEGRRRMDLIRELIGQMQREQDQTLTDQLRAAEDARLLTIRTAIVTSLLAIAILGVLLYVVRRDIARVRISEERLSTTLRSIGDAVIAADADALVMVMNPVAEALTGWTAKDATGRPMDHVFRIINEQTRTEVPSPVERVLREGRIVGLANHTLLVRRDGVETPIEDSAAPIVDAEGELLGVVLVFRDATATRTAERALREADRRKDEFLAMLAHELRNPLAPIRQAVQVARSPGATEGQVRWSHDVIDRQIGHMARLLEDLLDVSRITRGTLEVRRSRVELSAVIDAAIEMARPLIDARRHVLSIDVPRETIALDADPLRLAQVIGNLLTNAAKYTHANGQIRLHAHRDGTTIELRIADNGIGLDSESLTSIFQMFQQVGAPLDRNESGLGIGLALAKGLVELHDGTIEARSAGLGHGSEFIVRLPVVSSDGVVVELAPVETEARGETNGHPLTVLVADDNLDAAESLAMLLKINGHRVELAHDGATALDAIMNVRPDIALLDIGMPNLSGYEVAQRVREQPWGANVTLVAITGWGQVEDKYRAAAAGFDHHWVKPVDPNAVLALCDGARAEGHSAFGLRTHGH